MKRSTKAIVGLICVVSTWNGGIYGAEPRLLRPQETESRLSESRSPTTGFQVLGSSAVDVDFEALAQSLERGQTLIFDLAPELEARAVAERIWITSDQGFAWKGRIVGQPWSSVVVVVHKGVLTAGISLGERRFQILPGSENSYRVEEIDLRLLPDGNDVVHPPDPVRRVSLNPSEVGRPEVAAVPSKVKTTFDLLVVYTKRARDRLGSKNAIESLIQLGVAETNTALDDSKARSKFKLKDARQVSYKEKKDMSIDLARLQRTSDGKLDAVHGLRNTNKADFVKLVVDRRDSDRCGIAYLSPKSSVPSTFAFSVTRYDCISPNYTFGHELGHNLGLAHARGSATIDPFLPFGWGYYEPGGLFRTMMAIFRSGEGRRVLHYSNPKIREDGKRTGVGRNKPDSADAARAIRNARALLASYR
ncbi:MAG: M12 family metallo-peptidase [Acidobacteriota bacterium]|nr:M12 family metallo-peptidase [Acidobacteriota bacterium]